MKMVLRRRPGSTHWKPKLFTASRKHLTAFHRHKQTTENISSHLAKICKFPANLDKNSTIFSCRRQTRAGYLRAVNRLRDETGKKGNNAEKRPTSARAKTNRLSRSSIIGTTATATDANSASVILPQPQKLS